MLSSGSGETDILVYASIKDNDDKFDTGIIYEDSRFPTSWPIISPRNCRADLSEHGFIKHGRLEGRASLAQREARHDFACLKLAVSRQ
jgi:hypothetical protein